MAAFIIIYIPKENEAQYFFFSIMFLQTFLKTYIFWKYLCSPKVLDLITNFLICFKLPLLFKCERISEVGGFFVGQMEREGCNLSSILAIKRKKSWYGWYKDTREIFLAFCNLSCEEMFKKYHYFMSWGKLQEKKKYRLLNFHVHLLNILSVSPTNYRILYFSHRCFSEANRRFLLKHFLLFQQNSNFCREILIWRVFNGRILRSNWPQKKRKGNIVFNLWIWLLWSKKDFSAQVMLWKHSGCLLVFW